MTDNFCRHFLTQATNHPQRPALRIPQMQGLECAGEDVMTYGELNQLAGALQRHWLKNGASRGMSRGHGLTVGDRVVVIAKPSPALYAVVLSLLASGLVAVFIDTGMGKTKIRQALQDADAKAIVSMKSLLKLRWLIPELRKISSWCIDGAGLFLRALPMTVRPDDKLQLMIPPEHDHGLISFTSGSTGRPKGADRTHNSLDQQHFAIRHHWPDKDGEVDSPCFPVLVLHNLSCGMSTVMPKVDLAAPAQVNVEPLVAHWQQHSVERISGAPAYFSAVCDYLIGNDQSLPQITSLSIGGAPVSLELANKLREVFPNAWARIAYGSTEAEPIAALELDDYLNFPDPSVGLLVGSVVDEAELLIANLDSDGQPIACDQGEAGEILVAGPHVLQGYYHNPVADKANKIPRPQGDVWHRTGDVGYFDSDQRLWLTGRLVDAIRLKSGFMQPFPLEQQLDQLAGIQRSAAVQCGERLCLFVVSDHVLDDIEILIEEFMPAASWLLIRLKEMPVDGRHNSKIDRPGLRQQIADGKLKNKLEELVFEKD